MAKAPENILGVWMQPIDSFAEWKARGVNTLIGCADGPADPDRVKWRKAARDAGLFYFDWPSDSTLADLSADANDDHLLALMQPDEPDTKFLNGDQSCSVEQLRKNYDAFKSTGKPTYLGFDLWQLLWRKYDYAGAVRCCDLAGGDYYPLNRSGDPSGITTFGSRIDDLKSIAGGRPVYLAIETSNQKLIKQGWPPPTSRGPTLAEWMAQVWLARSKGCEIFYFPDVIGLNWEAWDGTPLDIAAAMPGVAAALMPTAPAAQPRSYTITVTDDAGNEVGRSTFKPISR